MNLFIITIEWRLLQDIIGRLCRLFNLYIEHMELTNLLFQPPIYNGSHKYIVANGVPVFLYKHTSSNHSRQCGVRNLHDSRRCGGRNSHDSRRCGGRNPHYHILYFHGNAEDAPRSMESVKNLADRLSSYVYVVEYPGYSVYNSQSPSVDRVIQDAETVYRWLIKTVQPKHIIIVGLSIGTGPASHLAQNPVALTVLLAPFTSICDLVYERVGMLSWLVKDSFCNRLCLEKTRCPVLLVHGISDTLIPYTHSETLAKCSDKCQILLVQAGHNTISHHWSTILDRVEKMLSPTTDKR